MKKFLPLLFVALLASAVVSAQELRYGITGALNFSHYDFSAGGLSLDTDSRLGFKAGFRMEMDAPFIYDGFYFDMEALLSSKGAKYDTAIEGGTASYTARPYYLEVPIHIGYKYMFGSSEWGVFASFGPYLGVGLFGSDKLSVNSSTEPVDTADIDTSPDSFSSETLKRFDFGLGLRAGVQMFDHYRIYVGYDWGLINIAKMSQSKIHNRNFYVGAAYMF